MANKMQNTTLQAAHWLLLWCDAVERKSLQIIFANCTRRGFRFSNRIVTVKSSVGLATKEKIRSKLSVYIKSEPILFTARGLVLPFLAPLTLTFNQIKPFSTSKCETWDYPNENHSHELFDFPKVITNIYMFRPELELKLDSLITSMATHQY